MKLKPKLQLVNDRLLFVVRVDEQADVKNEVVTGDQPEDEKGQGTLKRRRTRRRGHGIAEHPETIKHPPEKQQREQDADRRAGRVEMPGVGRFKFGQPQPDETQQRAQQQQVD